MAGETQVATALELALVEALSDANCLQRSLREAAEEATKAGGYGDLVAQLKTAVEEIAGAAQDLIFGAFDTTGITAERHWKVASDPAGAISRELALARADARALQIHLERATAFGREHGQATEATEKTSAPTRADVIAATKAKEAADASEATEADVDQAAVDKVLAAAKAAGSKAPMAKPAAPAAKAAPTKAAPAAKK